MLWLSNAIDSGKPENAPSRRTALYCADSIDLCVYFLTKQSVDLEDIRLYEVQVEDHRKAPFCVTHIVHRRLENGENVDGLIQEYWHPTRDWNYFEYLTMKFKVTAKLDLPDINTIILAHRYSEDRDRALAIG